MQLNTGKKGQNQLLEDSHDYTINTLLCQHNFCQRLKYVMKIEENILSLNLSLLMNLFILFLGLFPRMTSLTIS